MSFRQPREGEDVRHQAVHWSGSRQDSRPSQEVRSKTELPSHKARAERDRVRTKQTGLNLRRRSKWPPRGDQSYDSPGRERKLAIDIKPTLRQAWPRE